MDVSPQWPDVIAILRNLLDAYRTDTGSGSSLARVSRTESANVVRYHPNPDQPERFHPHADAWHTESATRQISVILLFPSSFLFMHEGRPPISEPKTILVTWLHFEGPTAYRSHPI